MMFSCWVVTQHMTAPTRLVSLVWGGSQTSVTVGVTPSHVANQANKLSPFLVKVGQKKQQTFDHVVCSFPVGTPVLVVSILGLGQAAIVECQAEVVNGPTCGGLAFAYYQLLLWWFLYLYTMSTIKGAIVKRAASSGNIVSEGGPKKQCGLCYCNACGKSSKDVGFKSQAPRANCETEWAGKRKFKNGAEVPDGPACRSCWASYTSHFDFLDWDTYCAKLNDDQSQYKEFLQEACSLEKGNTEPSWKPHTVTSSQKCCIQVSRGFMGLTSNEVRKELGLEKISKSLLNTLASVQVISEEGKQETLYLFSHKTLPYRTVNVMMTNETDLSKTLLKDTQQSWTQQGREIWKTECTTKKEEERVQGALNSLSIVALEEWKEKHVGGAENVADAQPEKDAEQTTADGVDEFDEDEGVAIGSAALLAEQARPKSQPKKQSRTPQTNCKRRRGLGATQAGAPSNSGGELSLMLAEAMEDDEMSVAGTVLTTNIVQEAESDDLAHWKDKLPLHKAMHIKIDGRTLTGLKNAVERNEAQNTAEAPLLRKYLEKVDNAIKLRTKNLSSFTETEVRAVVHSIECDGVQLVESIKQKLVEKQASVYISKSYWYDILHTINPFVTMPWCSKHPSVSMLAADNNARLATFESIYSSSVLFKFIDKGADGVGSAVGFSTAGLKFLLEDDTTMPDKYELGKLDDVCLGNATCIFKTVLALAAEDVHTNKQEH
eukprot:2014786-Amphidinium_carterae.3